MEDVDLRYLAEDAFSSLESTARERNVTLTAEGEAKVNGVRRLLYEVLYNLCENGIKYNKEGGNVNVSFKETQTDCRKNRYVYPDVRHGKTEYPPY